MKDDDEDDDEDEEQEFVDQNDNDDEMEQISTRSSQSIEQNSSGVDESLRRTPSSLNNYTVLPPIRPGITDDERKQKASIKKLKEKYVMIEDQPEKTGSIELGKNDKLDDAYLKMKRLDKALEEAFEKERQVKIETMSLMKKLRSEMQSMAVAFNDESHSNSHAETNLKRFLALDDEILKYDPSVTSDEVTHPMESIFKTQLSDPLGDSSSTTGTEKGSNSTNKRSQQFGKTKKSSISSHSTTLSRDPTRKGKAPEKDFIKRNIALAKEIGGTWALTDEEKQRLDELLKEDEQSNAVALPSQATNGYIPSINETERLKEIDDLLEREYYNPLLNHQIRRNHQLDLDYSAQQQIAEEENEYMENHFGDRALKETRLQREHRQRLKKIDEQLEELHRPKTEEKFEAILSDEQLNELLGQCTIDSIKQQFSFLKSDQPEKQELDFNALTDYALSSYVEYNRESSISDDVIQSLLDQAKQEGITMRQITNEILDDDNESLELQRDPTLSFGPAIDRPLSSASSCSYVDQVRH